MTGPWKREENQNQVSHFPTVARDDDSCSIDSKNQNPLRKSAANAASASSLSTPPSVSTATPKPLRRTVKIRQPVPPRHRPRSRIDSLADDCTDSPGL